MDNIILANCIVIVLGIVLFIISFISYSFAIYLFLIFFPVIFHIEVLEGWDAFPAHRIIIVLLFFSALFKLRNHWDKFPHKKFIYSYLIFVFGCMLSALFSPLPWPSFTRSLSYLAPLMTFVIIYVAALDHKNGLKYIFKGLIIGVTITILYGIMEFAWQENILVSIGIIHSDANFIGDIRVGSGRISSFIGQPVYFGIYLVIIACAAFFYQIYYLRNPISKLVIFIILFGIAFCVIYTGTRTAILFTIIFLFIYILLLERKIDKFKYMVYAATIIIIMIVTVPKFIDYNIDSYNLKSHDVDLYNYAIVDERSAPSKNLVGRAAVTLAMWAVFKEHPLTGLGPGYAYRMDQASGNLGIGGAENQYAAILMDSGIIGFISYVVFLIITFSIINKSIVSPFKGISEWGKMVQCIFISIIITSISYCLISMEVFHILMIYLAMLFAMERLSANYFLVNNNVAPAMIRVTPR